MRMPSASKKFNVENNKQSIQTRGIVRYKRENREMGSVQNLKNE